MQNPAWGGSPWGGGQMNQGGFGGMNNQALMPNCQQMYGGQQVNPATLTPAQLQQWQQWQQQYQEWQQQYGQKYEESLKAMNQGGAAPPLPIDSQQAPPLPPDEVKPPLPGTPASAPDGKGPTLPTADPPEELSEAEKNFDVQFKQWEQQFEEWKQQNVAHPDKTQYREYEKKWESWREQLLERREQMRKKRLAAAPPVRAPATTPATTPASNPTPPPKKDVVAPGRGTPNKPARPKANPKGPYNSEPLSFKKQPSHSVEGKIGESPKSEPPPPDDKMAGNNYNWFNLPPNLTAEQRRQVLQQMQQAKNSQNEANFDQQGNLNQQQGNLDQQPGNFNQMQGNFNQQPGMFNPQQGNLNQQDNSNERLCRGGSNEEEKFPPAFVTSAPVVGKKNERKNRGRDRERRRSRDCSRGSRGSRDREDRKSMSPGRGPGMMQPGMMPGGFNQGNFMPNFNHGPGFPGMNMGMPMGMGGMGMNMGMGMGFMPGMGFGPGNMNPGNFGMGMGMGGFNQGFGFGPGMNQGPGNFNGGPGNFNCGPGNFDGPRNFIDGPDGPGGNRGPGNFNDGPRNFIDGPDGPGGNRGPGNFNDGPRNFIDGPDGPGGNRGPGNFNDGPRNFIDGPDGPGGNRGPGNFNDGPRNFIDGPDGPGGNRGPGNFNDGPRNFIDGPDGPGGNRGPGNFNDGPVGKREPGNFNDGPGGNRGQGNFNDGPDGPRNFIDGPGGNRVNDGSDGPRVFNDGPDRPLKFDGPGGNRGPGNFNDGPDGPRNFNDGPGGNRGPGNIDGGLVGPRNFNDGPGNFGSPRGFQEGLGNNPGPDNFNLRPGDNRGPLLEGPDRGRGNFNDGPRNFRDVHDNFSDGPRDNRGPGYFMDGPGIGKDGMNDRGWGGRNFDERSEDGLRGPRGLMGDNLDRGRPANFPDGPKSMRGGPGSWDGPGFDRGMHSDGPRGMGDDFGPRDVDRRAMSPKLRPNQLPSLMDSFSRSGPIPGLGDDSLNQGPWNRQERGPPGRGDGPFSEGRVGSSGPLSSFNKNKSWEKYEKDDYYDDPFEEKDEDRPKKSNELFNRGGAGPPFNRDFRGRNDANFNDRIDNSFRGAGANEPFGRGTAEDSFRKGGMNDRNFHAREDFDGRGGEEFGFRGFPDRGGPGPRQDESSIPPTQLAGFVGNILAKLGVRGTDLSGQGPPSDDHSAPQERHPFGPQRGPSPGPQKGASPGPIKGPLFGPQKEPSPGSTEIPFVSQKEPSPGPNKGPPEGPPPEARQRPPPGPHQGPPPSGPHQGPPPSGPHQGPPPSGPHQGPPPSGPHQGPPPSGPHQGPPPSGPHQGPPPSGPHQGPPPSGPHQGPPPSGPHQGPPPSGPHQGPPPSGQFQELLNNLRQRPPIDPQQRPSPGRFQGGYPDVSAPPPPIVADPEPEWKPEVFDYSSMQKKEEDLHFEVVKDYGHGGLKPQSFDYGHGGQGKKYDYGHGGERGLKTFDYGHGASRSDIIDYGHGDSRSPVSAADRFLEKHVSRERSGSNRLREKFEHSSSPLSQRSNPAANSPERRTAKDLDTHSGNTQDRPEPDIRDSERERLWELAMRAREEDWERDDWEHGQNRSPILRRSRSPVQRSPIQRARSPIQRARSPIQRARSPIQRARSPIQRARSPTQRARSPVPRSRSRSPIQRSRSPIPRTRSPQQRSRSPRRAGRKDEKQDGLKQKEVKAEAMAGAAAAESSGTSVGVSSILVEDLIHTPGRSSRPSKIVFILRGIAGSGKSYVTRLIKEKEVELGGSAPRILSLDDYFMTDVEEEVKDSESGQRMKKKVMKYEYDADMEDVYQAALLKAFKKTVSDGFFQFIIVDSVNKKLKEVEEMWSFAKLKGFQVYVCEMDNDVSTCSKRNIHNRTEAEVEEQAKGWEVVPNHYLRLDIRSLLQSEAIEDVEMEDVVEEDQTVKNASPATKETSKEEDEDVPAISHFLKSKWDDVESSGQLLDRLDGIKKKKPAQASMEAFLSTDEFIPTRKALAPGKKRVRWADMEERERQEKMRAIGFVVGQTDWKRMMDPTCGESALTKTKYI